MKRFRWRGRVPPCDMRLGPKAGGKEGSGVRVPGCPKGGWVGRGRGRFREGMGPA